MAVAAMMPGPDVTCQPAWFERAGRAAAADTHRRGECPRRPQSGPTRELDVTYNHRRAAREARIMIRREGSPCDSAAVAGPRDLLAVTLRPAAWLQAGPSARVTARRRAVELDKQTVLTRKSAMLWQGGALELTPLESGPAGPSIQRQ